MEEKVYTKQEVYDLMCKAFIAGYRKFELVEAGLEGMELETEVNWILSKSQQTDKIY